MSEKQKASKAFDNVVSRGQLDAARTEATEIRNRVRQLEADLFEALEVRVRELDAALVHLREGVATLKEARALRGRG